jgi:HlyD family secretion protein
LSHILKTKIVITPILLLGVSLFLLQCSRDSNQSRGNGSDALIPAVEAVQAKYGSLPLTERLSGRVKAKNQVEIYPQVSAAVTQVYVNDGDVVQRGEPLVQLRDREFSERLKQAKAAYRIAQAQRKQAEVKSGKAQSELRRMQALADKQLASEAQLETVQTEAMSAQADVELARAREEQANATVEEEQEALSQTTIRAPVAGTVGNRNAEIGMLVNSNTRLFTLGQLDSVRVEVILTDRMLNYLEPGQPADIYFENSPSSAIRTSLTRISPFLHPVTHSTDAEIDMANPDGKLKSGMFVVVDIYYGESEQATLVPLSALYENPGTGATGLYVSQDSLPVQPAELMNDEHNMSLTDPVPFEFVPVNILAKGRMEAAVSSIEPGDWVVTIGHDLLGSSSGSARVRPVDWKWVERLQSMQREDLLREVMERQQAAKQDTASGKPQNPRSD